MKRIALIIITLVMGASAWAQSQINFGEVLHDFGTIKEADGPVTCKFEFTNDGNEPLVIVTASADCGCTRPKFDPKPIEPGKSSVIEVKFNPNGYSGEFKKTIKVRTNAPKQKNVKLRITGVVIPNHNSK